MPNLQSYKLSAIARGDKDLVEIIEMAERVEELKSVERDFWKMYRLQEDAHNDFLRMDQINQRYGQALEEIKKITTYDDGREEEVYNIATKALEESE